jgi:hypothetical protein
MKHASRMRRECDKMLKKILISFSLLWLCVSLSSCKASHEEKPLIKAGRMHGYEALNPDEEALLRIRMALILKHMQILDYPFLLDTWQLPELAKNPQYRTQFLNLMYCTDRWRSYNAVLPTSRLVQSKAETYIAHREPERQRRRQTLFKLRMGISVVGRWCLGAWMTSFMRWLCIFTKST